MKKFLKKTSASKNEPKEEGIKTSSPQPKHFAENYIEEIEPSEKKEFVTYKQISYIWTKKGWAVIGIRYGDVASRNITRDIRKIVEENRPLKKVIHKEEPD
jgi:hypothetical protein